ncbi:MAG: hypothetical protein ACEY3K_11370, partial [Wolbachia sp.]
CLKIHPSIYRNYQSLQIFCPILTSLSLNLMAVGLILRLSIEQQAYQLKNMLIKRDTSQIEDKR